MFRDGETTVRTVRREGWRRIEAARTVDAEVGAAWKLLATPARWPEWGPSVHDVDADEEGAPVVAGRTGRVRVGPGARLSAWVPFEVVDCDAPGEAGNGRWRWAVGRIPATGHRVARAGAGRTRVCFDAPLAATGYVPVLRRGLERIDALLSE